MKNKPYPAFCIDCKWSKTYEDRSWVLYCTNPIINANDSWALASSVGEGKGSEARAERNKTGIFAKCGIKGKLWESK